MLGRYVRVKVSNPIGSKSTDGFVHPLNFGLVENVKDNQTAYIMGIHHPVNNFDGRVIAHLFKRSDHSCTWIVAPKSTRFIVNDIKEFIDLDGDFRGCTLECLYESSCGAVVFNDFGNERKFLLIKNKRSANWGFPKGHIEDGETHKETAVREVLEETGLNIKILKNFETKSAYKIQGKIEKKVTIFIARALNTDIVLQEEEIDSYSWVNYEKAMETLKFENDKNILKAAHEYLVSNA